MTQIEHEMWKKHIFVFTSKNQDNDASVSGHGLPNDLPVHLTICDVNKYVSAVLIREKDKHLLVVMCLMKCQNQ